MSHSILFPYLIVFLGGGLGSAMRHGVNGLAARLLGYDFPFGTLGVNVIGSLMMGFLAGYFAFKGEATQSWRLFLATGLLGGFTTFSAFSLETIALWEREAIGPAALYVALSLTVSLTALLMGLVLARSMVG